MLSSTLRRLLNKQPDQWIKSTSRLLVTNTRTSPARKFDVLAGGDSKPRVLKRPCEDAFFLADAGDYYAIGVADGVGQWRSAGYDPTIFPTTLMDNCHQLMMTKGYSDPLSLLNDSYDKLIHDKQVEGGSATVCLLILNKFEGTLKSLTLGDSSFYLVRDTQLLHTPNYQLYSRDAPYQLAIVPPSAPNTTISSKISDATLSTFELKENDHIIAATDGFIDNLYDEELIEELNDMHNINDALGAARILCSRAYQLASRPDRIAPSHSRRTGGKIIDDLDIEYGGIIDDITVVVGMVTKT
ncbi:uncharacterized protein TRIADDRAFT_54668 [Trichoplax adhaerens]|uniref:Protein phosphatase n=1 Tax=Trichoplax adhaerens TaxID=10228 RepID=B3RSN4_TRIAD|nr:hypothetical protein TRIADDRAFT_54668 [Trichoplax adhaerens]EDV27085.1 hypothetical protein TRIADDRAFT_54668 [Trichoplax adhaerens]|eukprot:XP_002111081.1 hypothetical protein TRIADDRAFT_54668 [Trichoplax adhaerens]